MRQLYDKNRIPIETGDVLKVFHFIGIRNKRHYMYKVAGPRLSSMHGWCASDLVLNKESPHSYRLDYNADENGVIADTEIVSSGGPTCFTDRKKLK